MPPHIKAAENTKNEGCLQKKENKKERDFSRPCNSNDLLYKK
jgi:hypothetical protein